MWVSGINSGHQVWWNLYLPNQLVSQRNLYNMVAFQVEGTVGIILALLCRLLIKN